MPTPTNCYPWWHAPLTKLASQPGMKTSDGKDRIVPSGCGMDSTGNVPCSPATMRATSETWLAQNMPAALATIGGHLGQDVYTFARYMHSEVGSGTIEERIAVGEAGFNQLKARGGLSAIGRMLTPNGKYGAIHVPAARCAAEGCKSCNCDKRWAATSRDPSIIAIVLAHFVLTGQSDGFAGKAETQWGPEALKNADGTYMGSGTTRAKVESFVRYAASEKLFWVGPLPGVDPWHTFLTYKGNVLVMANTATREAAIKRGIEALPLSANGMPIRPKWPATMPVCAKGVSVAGVSGAEIALALLGLAAGATGAVFFNRWLATGKPV